MPDRFRYGAVAGLVMGILVLAACDSEQPPVLTPPPAAVPTWSTGQELIGVWTDGLDSLVISKKQGDFTSACTSGIINGPLRLDACAAFDASGSMGFSTGAATSTTAWPAGVPSPTASPPDIYRFTGWVDGDKLFLVVSGKVYGHPRVVLLHFVTNTPNPTYAPVIPCA
jgi:hypothetical protein